MAESVINRHSNTEIIVTNVENAHVAAYPSGYSASDILMAFTRIYDKTNGQYIITGPVTYYRSGGIYTGSTDWTGEVIWIVKRKN